MLLTHYYKLAHSQKIHYSVLVSNTNNHQELLELELKIRHYHPNILITYYNKCLYYFSFDHNYHNNQLLHDVINEYDNLQIKFSNTITADQYSNPPKSGPSNGINGDDEEEFFPFEPLSFLKAVKKMVLYELSSRGLVQLFGNYCAISEDDKAYSILCIDPILFPNGDLMISCVQREPIRLFPTRMLDYNSDPNFVIYLVPSGIRCHLFDPTNLQNNFVESNNLDNADLLELLQLSTGISYGVDSDIAWFKLIPNLKHLNNQASPIAKFVHTVENRKFILWPWNLCLVQLGKVEQLPEEIVVDEIPRSANPLSLISEFVDFQITHHRKQQEQQIQQQQEQHQENRVSTTGPFNVPSVPSSIGDIGSVGPMTQMEGPKDIGSIDMNMNTPISAELFNLQSADAFFKNDNGSEIKEESEQIASDEKDEEDMEIDDLFGGDDDEDESELFEDEEDKGSKEDDENKETEEPNADLEQGEKLDGLFDNMDNKSKDEEEIKKDETDIQKETLKRPYFDIPKDQMMISKYISPDYNDPGAPLPIIPTPFVSSTMPQSAITTNPPSAPPIPDNPDYPEETSNMNVAQSAPRSSIPEQKSIFSPILFNPIIKSNIDTKYGKGGKFYVDRESSVDPSFDKKRREMRATSVSGLEISFNREDKESKLHHRQSSLEDIYDSESSSSEESDVDEEVIEDDITNSPPLKLNTYNESAYYPPGSIGAAVNGGNNQINSAIIQQAEFPSSSIAGDKPGYNPALNTGGFGSPFTNQLAKFPTLKADSPFSSHEMQSGMSPIDFENAQVQQTPKLQPMVAQSDMAASKGASSETSPMKSINEPSNYLPLILRSINISTIPNVFLMNNLTSKQLLPNFSINDDDLDNDLEITKSNEMIIKHEHLREFLNFLSPNIVYDFGLNNPNQSGMEFYFKGFNPKKTDLSSNFVRYHAPPKFFKRKFSEIFPYSYRVNMIEFLRDYKELESEDPLDNQLSFLEDITNDDDDFDDDPKKSYKKLKSLEWDSFDLDNTDKETFEKYRDINTKLNSNIIPDQESCFKLPVVKTKILKNNNIINLNSLGLDYWKYLNFSPVRDQKNFQILVIDEGCGNHDSRDSCASEFLDLLSYNYGECNFGNISRVNLSTVETRPDLESVSNGVQVINREKGQSYNDFYIQTNKKLISLVELIKLDLINKTNNFEFDRPLLLLFVNYNKSLNSVLQICKIFRNFKVALTQHQLPLVQIFSKIIPASLIVKRLYGETHLKVLSNHKLTRLSMNLYNECPNDLANNDISKYIYTSIVKEPPTKIQFKFMNTSARDNNFNDDIFLHLAYEGSVDKKWFSAAWSDPSGSVTYTKSWYCANNPASSNGTNGNYRNDASDIASISDDIWNISLSIFKNLNDEMNNKATTVGGKKFLVLTRVNSVIPDDELVQWKRLSIKHKEISLIVLSVSQSPKLIFASDYTVSYASEIAPSPTGLFPMNVGTQLRDHTPLSQDRESFFKAFSTSDNSSPGTGGPGMVASPNGLIFHSPQQFVNVPANFLSPQDPTSGGGIGTSTGGMSNSIGADMNLHDPESEIVGIIPKIPLPSFNSPSRLGMKIGYLIKEWDREYGDHGIKDFDFATHLAFEVNLLSCSNYWDLDVLMTLILNHYKKLIALNDILCMRDIDGKMMACEAEEEGGYNDKIVNYEISGLIPWHIAAVGKSLDYLVHVYVEE
ncbi:SSN2 [[Candida] subhashii]|uniref:Mediator of RNA polymerase II transcription subunit 13 n=1 Tax=[Candida] subhashii TaxID=561895 RepID=A0A8J5Q808_9ASCO|nr:SSN2 [[Candida] subhashii]KAG7662714.1 SSN2 [[Candida] subhashii]